MQAITELPYYPISLDNVKAMVARKKGRKTGLSVGNGHQLTLFTSRLSDNIKEIVNEFGEKIVRVDGEIPIDPNGQQWRQVPLYKL